MPKHLSPSSHNLGLESRDDEEVARGVRQGQRQRRQRPAGGQPRAGLAGVAGIAAASSDGDDGPNNVPTPNNDNLVGTPQDDVISALAGDDIVDGLAGNDTITGGGGRDVFVFSAGAGDDLITDFRQGEDVIRINGGIAADIGDLGLAPSGGDLEITLATGDTITLQNLAGVTLVSGDFVFA